MVWSFFMDFFQIPKNYQKRDVSRKTRDFGWGNFSRSCVVSKRLILCWRPKENLCFHYYYDGDRAFGLHVTVVVALESGLPPLRRASIEAGFLVCYVQLSEWDGWQRMVLSLAPKSLFRQLHSTQRRSPRVCDKTNLIWTDLRYFSAFTILVRA